MSRCMPLSHFSGPGPAAYTLPSTIGFEKHDYRKYRQPQFTIGMRLKPLNSTSGPGPCPYEEKTFRKLMLGKQSVKKQNKIKKKVQVIDKRPRWKI